MTTKIVTKKAQDVESGDVFEAGGRSFEIHAIEKWDKTTTFYASGPTEFECILDVPNNASVQILILE